MLMFENLIMTGIFIQGGKKDREVKRQVCHWEIECHGKKWKHCIPETKISQDGDAGLPTIFNFAWKQWKIVLH